MSQVFKWIYNIYISAHSMFSVLATNQGLLKACNSNTESHYFHQRNCSGHDVLDYYIYLNFKPYLIPPLIQDLHGSLYLR